MSISSRFALTLLTLLTGFWSQVQATDSRAVTSKELEGAWELVSYRFSGGSPEVEGLQLMQDGHFSIAYSMQLPEEERSARSHAGTYQVEESGKISYDVEWWVQKVGDECGIVESTRVSPTYEYDGLNLKLNFSSGSSQHWRRIENPEK